MRHSFAIIGGGLTSTSMLCQLVDRLEQTGGEGRALARKLSVAIFERQPELGPGLPHNGRYVLPFHITNMCGRDMSVRAANPHEFELWVQDHPEVLLRHDIEPAPSAARSERGQLACRHYPREVMGEYLQHSLEQAVRRAHQMGLVVDLRPNCEVTDLREADGRLQLNLQTAPDNTCSTYGADSVLLATGHWFPATGNDHYLSSPWPARLLQEKIPDGETVGVIGSSLSAIEVALTLTAPGRFVRNRSGNLRYIAPPAPRKIVLYSRRGLLPRVRGRIGARANVHCTVEALRRLIDENPGQLLLDPLVALLERELDAAYDAPVQWRQMLEPAAPTTDSLRRYIDQAKRGDGPTGELIWQTVLNEVLPIARDIYLNLEPGQRKRFDRCYNTLFFMHAATQPVINGEKLLALMEAGIVAIVPLGEHYRFFRDDTTGRFVFERFLPAGKTCRDTYRYVVDARGQPRSLATDPAPLSRNLLRRKMIQIEGGAAEAADQSAYAAGSVVIDPESHRVLAPTTGDRAADRPPLFAVGAMTRGQMIDASMAFGICRSTAIVVDQIIQLLDRTADP